MPFKLTPDKKQAKAKILIYEDKFNSPEVIQGMRIQKNYIHIKHNGVAYIYTLGRYHCDLFFFYNIW